MIPFCTNRHKNCGNVKCENGRKIYTLENQQLERIDVSVFFPLSSEKRKGKSG
jgi:hypothetical protein